MAVLSDIGAGGVAGAAVLVAAFVLWVLGHHGDETTEPQNDSNAPDKDGFIPADKYGYGYDYSWGDPYGDPDQ